jgi:hypothetical protein
MPSKMGDWSRYQYHEFSQADGGKETVEWADYVTRLWKKEKTPIDRMDHEVVLLVEEDRSNHDITDSAINRNRTDTQSLKRNRDQDEASIHVSKRLSTDVEVAKPMVTDLEIAKRKLIQKRMEMQKRALEPESQPGEASKRQTQKPSER